MIFVSATRLRVRSIFFLPGFMKANEASVKQLLQTPGYINGAELIDKGLVFWTLTMWKDDAAMRAFRNGEAHRKAMQKLPEWCNEASYLHWLQEENKLPDWQTVYDKMIQEGKLTKVRHPSERQAGKDFPTIQWKKLQRALQPKL